MKNVDFTKNPLMQNKITFVATRWLCTWSELLNHPEIHNISQCIERSEKFEIEQGHQPGQHVNRENRNENRKTDERAKRRLKNGGGPSVQNMHRHAYKNQKFHFQLLALLLCAYVTHTQKQRNRGGVGVDEEFSRFARAANPGEASRLLFGQVRSRKIVQKMCKWQHCKLSWPAPCKHQKRHQKLNNISTSHPNNWRTAWKWKFDVPMKIFY